MLVYEGNPHRLIGQSMACALETLCSYSKHLGHSIGKVDTTRTAPNRFQIPGTSKCLKKSWVNHGKPNSMACENHIMSHMAWLTLDLAILFLEQTHLIHVISR
jgi:hypothetical protein